MESFTQETLEQFTVRAKQSTYIGGSRKLLPLASGTKAGVVPSARARDRRQPFLGAPWAGSPAQAGLPGLSSRTGNAVGCDSACLSGLVQ
ncbi:MAG: hypothetical protein ACXVDN_12520 [Ktedonobacteraceae bacterium]